MDHFVSDAQRRLSQNSSKHNNNSKMLLCRLSCDLHIQEPPKLGKLLSYLPYDAEFTCQWFLMTICASNLLTRNTLSHLSVSHLSCPDLLALLWKSALCDATKTTDTFPHCRCVSATFRQKALRERCAERSFRIMRLLCWGAVPKNKGLRSFLKPTCPDHSVAGLWGIGWEGHPGRSLHRSLRRCL